MPASTLSDIQGQDRAVNEISERLRNGTFRGSFLFTGPDGVGKRMAARASAAALFCQDSPGNGCGNCSSCIRLREKSHPDFFSLEPDEKDSIKIDAARKLIRWLNLQPLESEHKVALIDRSECLTPEATNALLKSVEEPGESGIFILVTSAPGALLPTMQSRCQQIRFQPLAAPILRSLLSTLEDWRPATLEAVIPIAEGSLTQARQFGQWMESVESELPDLFWKLVTAPYSQLADHIVNLPTTAPGMACLLEGLRAVCRDLLLLLEWDGEKSELLIFPRSAELRKQLGQALHRVAVFKCIAALGEARMALRQHPAATLLWESVAFSLQKMLKPHHAA